jgi:hypothetical protein
MRNCKHVSETRVRVQLNEDIDPEGRIGLTYRISDSFFLFIVYNLFLYSSTMAAAAH